MRIPKAALSSEWLIHGSHLLDLIIDPLEECFALLLQRSLPPVEEPRNYFGVLELYFGLLIVRALDLDHVNLIDLLLYLLDLLIPTFYHFESSYSLSLSGVIIDGSLALSKLVAFLNR
jgi:hypothetical protein